jgi:hypothetical protein
MVATANNIGHELAVKWQYELFFFYSHSHGEHKKVGHRRVTQMGCCLMPVTGLGLDFGLQSHVLHHSRTKY